MNLPTHWGRFRVTNAEDILPTLQALESDYVLHVGRVNGQFEVICESHRFFNIPTGSLMLSVDIVNAPECEPFVKIPMYDVVVEGDIVTGQSVEVTLK